MAPDIVIKRNTFDDLDDSDAVHGVVDQAAVDMCDRIRSGREVFRAGQAGAATDVIGNPRLEANGVPAAARALLIDRADASVAPATGLFGCSRNLRAPGVGAIELAASAAPPTQATRPRFLFLRVPGREAPA